METKCDNDRMELAKREMKFDNHFVVNSMGKSGGLTLLWKDEVNVQFQSYTR